MDAQLSAGRITNDRDWDHINNKWNDDKLSIPFTTLMMNTRNVLYPDPFDEFDPHHTMAGKKKFITAKVRCMQAKIDLRNWQEEMPPHVKRIKENKKPTVKKEF